MFLELLKLHESGTSRLMWRGSLSAVCRDRLSADFGCSPEYAGTPQVDCREDRRLERRRKNREASTVRKGRGRRSEHGQSILQFI